ncbi:hypothetical protein ABQ283_09380, partial [Lactobacillus helveticus]|uniref:hypothetical protein n=2 Tax=Lactobacillus helveticus TaxID=1587 RepID=UPI0032EEFED6
FYQSLNQNSFGRRSVQRKRTKQPFNGCLILFIYSLSTGVDKEPKYFPTPKILDPNFNGDFLIVSSIN